jgi:hypothetical protein
MISGVAVSRLKRRLVCNRVAVALVLMVTDVATGGEPCAQLVSGS